MSLLRTTCDRCYTAKRRCTKDASSSKCHLCLRAGSTCNYSPRGQSGRPLGSATASSQPPALSASEAVVAVPATSRTPYRNGSTRFNGPNDVDVMAITGDGFVSGPGFQESASMGGGLTCLSQDDPMDTSTITLDDFICYAQTQHCSSHDMTLPLFLEGKPILRGPSPNLEFASASSTPPRCSDNSSAASSVSSQQHLSNEAGTQHAITSPEPTRRSASETLHARLVVVHHQLTTFSESLATSFNMAEDVEEIYRMSADFKSVVDSYQAKDTSYPPAPIVKCHGMTALLILGCYSYLMEAFEFLVEHLQSGAISSSDMDTSNSASSTGPSSAWPQPPRVPSPSSTIPHISVGSVRIPVSTALTAEIHKRLIHQTAQDLKASLRRCVRRMAAAQYVTLDVDADDDSWHPIAKLTELGQRELQRREDGIFMYLQEGL